ncbi:MAG: M60 family metallopeptidase [Rikenellaceae bacterium]
MNRKKIFSLLFAALTLSSQLVTAQDNSANLTSDMELFKDASCSQLSKKVKTTDAFKSRTLKNIAQAMILGNYQSEYLVAEYSAYPSAKALQDGYALNNNFSKYENITGVYLEEGEHVIFVSGTKGRSIKLLLPELMRKPEAGIEPTKDPKGWGLYKQEVELSEGVNIVNVEKSANAYISYFEDDYKKAPKIKVHFATGKVNGYFDTTRGDDNTVWDSLLENAVSPIMDARGNHIQVAYPVEWFKMFTKSQGVELIAAYDKMVYAQFELSGMVKYKKVPMNRIFARVNFNYYMFRDGDGVSYLGDKSTMGMVTDPNRVSKGDPCWGFSHEVGHAMQIRPLTWGGLTEVSNNIYSLNNLRIMDGDGPSRIYNSYEKARKSIIGSGKSYLHDNDVFNRLVPFWQLQLYFEENGHADFYADLMEHLRNYSKDYERNETINYQFDFIKACCDISKTDLTDFFDKWGFFYVGKISVNDYGQYNFNITQEMVDETKAYIASKNYKQPTIDITTIDESDK